MVVVPEYVLAPVKITVPVLVVGLLIVKLPELLMMPDKVNVELDGALIVAAPLMTIGLLNVKVLKFDNNIEFAPSVIGAEAAPKADAWPTFSVPLFNVMLVLMVFDSSKSNTPFVPANVNVDTLIGFD
jgi:hypothetical protein